MANHEVETQWMGKMQFNSLVSGHTVVMDAPERAGGEDSGPIPKPFVLVALSGCSGMDVAAILRKADLPFQDFSIVVVGELSKLPPMTYISIHMKYQFRGEKVNEQATLTAVMDSQEKYCGVSYLLKKAIPITWEVLYNGIEIFNNTVVIVNNTMP